MAIKRDPNNILNLEDREVFISFNPNATVGVYGLIDTKIWHTAGIETDDGSFGMTRELTEETVLGAGYGVVARSYKAGNVSSTVDLLEDNEVIRYIEWPDTVVDDDLNVQLLKHSSKVAQGVVLRVEKFTNGVVKMQISREPAFLTIPERSRGDQAAAKTLNIGYQADSDKVIFECTYFTVKDGQVVELKPKRFVADNNETPEGMYRVQGAGGQALELEIIEDEPVEVVPGG